MIKVEKLEVFNFDGAFRGMRNPLESWDKSDSRPDSGYNPELNKEEEIFHLGESDKTLAQKLIAAGSDHRKFMRQIFVSMDITAPLYWWKEMDTYHVATATNSCSTMHKLATTPITKECFSFDTDLENFDGDMQQYIDEEGSYLTYSETVIRNCESLRRKYLTTKDLRYWRALIQLLPESWNQRRTWTANYENLRNLCNARVNHKLIEWREFVEFLRFHAPYAQDLIFYKGE